ncbi:Polyadenylate-binding protein [Musa troglodytarum]|uniref:Polyadenylate-binding protein n=1 Tax=Musa troglodytarum TaxID=320322 RepID=A0A9E7KZZ9_9LILI|nr:Polyadenylate-binding protein [Musa troglodytarum]
MAQALMQQQAPNGTLATAEAAWPAPGKPVPVHVAASVTETQVFDLFSQIGPVVTVRVCRDLGTCRSLGYDYANYSNPVDAATALEVLNFKPLNNKPIRIMDSNQDHSMHRSGAANIFVKNLDKPICNGQLFDIFSAFGRIVSCTIAKDASGQSKGYGFVQFEQEEAAQNAINEMNGMLLNNKPVFVGPFIRKKERQNSLDKTMFSNVFVKNLSESTTNEDLENIFGEYGKITSAIVMREEDGKSKCFGFVNFEIPDDAARAVQELNGQKFDDKEWYVGKALKKPERELVLKKSYYQSAKETVDKDQGLNLYLKNLDDSVGDDELKELFSDFGTITSCKIMRNPDGMSKGFGFVAFSAPEEANRALKDMKGKMVRGKPLYVAPAQRKEDRRASLQARFSQVRPVAMGPGPSVGPRVPMYPPGAPGLGQQIFYGQPPPTLFPPQISATAHPWSTACRSTYAKFSAALVQKGQRVHQPLTLQQMVPKFRAHSYPPGGNVPDVQTPGAVGGMLNPNEMGGLPMQDVTMPQPIPIAALPSALANAPPEQQRLSVPLVKQLEPIDAAKVSGMLLEMDQTEVLHLLESPDALRAKVAEAMEVLRSVAQQQQANAPAD